MKKPIKYHTIRGKRYKIEFVNSRDLPKDSIGICDNPANKGKKIRVYKHLPAKKLLDTLIHELLHSAFFDLDEEAILETATDITNLLWRLGYRKTEED
jgi:hypothetical protein